MDIIGGYTLMKVSGLISSDNVEVGTAIVVALRLWVLDLLMAMREHPRTLVATHREAKRKAIVSFEVRGK